MSISSQLADPFWQTLLHRRSIRRYTDQPVPRPLLERLLTAAIWAPNAHNRQPWRFAVITDRSRQQQLAKSMAERWERDLLADGAAPELAQRRAAISRERIGTAGAIVVGCLSMIDMDHYPDNERQHLEWLMAAQSTTLALGNLLLAAHHEGLGACWMCAPLFAPERVKEILNLPDDWEPQASITLGYPAEKKDKTRKPIEDIVIWQ
ncbi:MAG: nitroreductase family protein [Chloroflexi bacterium]|nr:nitroreductase family protein [Chloroflexota bacterium]